MTPEEQAKFEEWKATQKPKSRTIESITQECIPIWARIGHRCFKVAALQREIDRLVKEADSLKTDNTTDLTTALALADESAVLAARAPAVEPAPAPEPIASPPTLTTTEPEAAIAAEPTCQKCLHAHTFHTRWQAPSRTACVFGTCSCNEFMAA